MRWREARTWNPLSSVANFLRLIAAFQRENLALAELLRHYQLNVGQTQFGSAFTRGGASSKIKCMGFIGSPDTRTLIIAARRNFLYQYPRQASVEKLCIAFGGGSPRPRRRTEPFHMAYVTRTRSPLQHHRKRIGVGDITDGARTRSHPASERRVLRLRSVIDKTSRPPLQLTMALRIHTSFQGVAKYQDFSADKVLIGRPDGGGAPSLDLSPDACVSRQHAEIELKMGVCWITDLGSKFGTRVNGREISAQGEWRLEPTDIVVIGETRLRVTVLGDPRPAVAKAIQPEPSAESRASARHKESGPIPSVSGVSKPGSAPEPKIVHTIDTSRSLTFPQTNGASTTERRLALLLDLPRQFSARASLNDLLQTIMNRVVEVIPAGRRGALLLRDAQHDALLLKAYVSASEPAVSETLARRAMNEKRGFLWRSGQNADPSQSVQEFNIVSGLYAPLQWHDRVFGVICVDSPNLTDTFHEEDLQFLVAIGHYAGMALAERNLLDESGRKAKVVNRLLANFSPKVRAVLLEQATHGKLRPGGEKSELTILFCDICNFTRSSAQMDANDVVEMLNDYFQPIIEAVFRHDGTVDKFVGDAILAVFGGPEPDLHHPQKAVTAALAIQDAVRATTEQRAARHDVTCQVRVGVHAGEVFHGFIGALDRLEYTVIGDAVNRAHRYCEAAGEGQILISPEVFQRVFNVVRADKASIATKEGELLAYRLKELKT